MSFSKYVCWKEYMVETAMDTEALQPPPHVFAATHVPMKMYRAESTDLTAKKFYDERTFLEDFLKKQKPEAKR